MLSGGSRGVILSYQWEVGLHNPWLESSEIGAARLWADSATRFHGSSKANVRFLLLAELPVHCHGVSPLRAHRADGWSCGRSVLGVEELVA